jgi:hypothetical protein
VLPSAALASCAVYTPRSRKFVKLNIAYIYCGDADKPNGIPDRLRKKGHHVFTADRRNGVNLEDDSEWAKVMAFIEFEADFTILSPPCGTFSHSRTHQPGPRVLRTRSEPYGIRNPDKPFTGGEKKQLQMGTVHAIKSCLAARAAAAVGGGFALEYPAVIFDDQASLSLLSEAKDLDKICGVFDWTTDQCPFGAETTKPTTFKAKTNGSRELWTAAARKCTHVESWMNIQDNRGNWTWQLRKHAPLIAMKSASGQWATAAAETYPQELDDMLIEFIIDSGKAQRPRKR